MDLDDLYLIYNANVESNNIISSTYANYAYSPSNEMQDFFRASFIRPYMENTRNGLWLGYSKNEVLESIIERGKANFDSAYNANNRGTIEVSPYLRVLAYCFWNMRLHYYSFIHIFQLLTNDFELNYFLKKIFKSDYRTLFIDIGCGPMTSALAFAEFFYTRTQKPVKINYVGIDTSKAMLEWCKKHSVCQLFEKNSSFNLYNTVPSVDIPHFESAIVINCSFLFFNITPESNWIDEYSYYVNQIALNYSQVNIILIYQNPDADCLAYDNFKSKLKFLKLGVCGSNKIAYKHQSDKDSNVSNVRYEVLFNDKAAKEAGLYTSSAQLLNLKELERCS